MKMVRLKAYAILIGYAAYAADDCADARKSPVMCYECTTIEAGEVCADPFNESEAKQHDKVSIEECKQGSCAKWVQRPKTGPVHIIRTCSSKMPLNLKVSLVCMKESRPGDGELCFCHDDLCNTASRPLGHLQSSHFITRYFLLLISTLFAMCITSFNTRSFWNICITTHSIEYQHLILAYKSSIETLDEKRATMLSFQAKYRKHLDYEQHGYFRWIMNILNTCSILRNLRKGKTISQISDTGHMTHLG